MSDGWSAEIEAAWVAEAKRRAEEIDRGELELVDSVEMMARLRERAAIKRERSARLGTDPSVPHAELSPETALERGDTGDELDDHERAALDAAISRSLDQEARGETKPVEQVLALLRARRRQQAVDDIARPDSEHTHTDTKGAAYTDASD